MEGFQKVIGKDIMIPKHTAVGRRCKVLPETGLPSVKRGSVPADIIVDPVVKTSQQSKKEVLT